MEQFRRTITRLRERFPAAYPVRVKLVKRQGSWLHYFGDCALKTANDGSQYFLIRIVDFSHAEWLGVQVMIDTLTHEWAHAIAWNHRHNSHPELGYHGPDWGVAYAAIFASIYQSR